MEFYLSVWLKADNTFKVFSGIRHPLADSILIVDYRYRPWPRTANLLW